MKGGESMVDKYKVIFTATIDTKELESQTKKISEKKINIGAKQAQKDVKGLSQSIGDAIKKTLEWTLATGAVFGTLQQLRKGVEYIKDLDKSMTAVQIVTGKTSDEIRQLSSEFNNLAKEMGATTIEVAEGSLEWFRQGKTAEEAQELVRASLIASKLANMESAQATEYLTSILNGFKLEATDAIKVLDKLVEVDNQSATSVAELAEALKRSSNSAQQAGVDFDTLVAYIATVSSVTRKSAGSIGESFKTLFARMQNLKLNQLDEVGESASDVEKVLKAFTNTTLFDAKGQFRDMDDVLYELSLEWETLSQKEKSYIAIAIAGVRQRENFLVLMENFNDVLEFQEMQADASGRALERFEIYMKSVEARANTFKATWEGLWQDAITSEAVGRMYDLGTSMLEFLDKAGGIPKLIERIVFFIALLNAELIGTKAIGIIAFFRNFWVVLSNLIPILMANISSLGVLNGTILTLNGLMGSTAVVGGAVAIAIYSVIKAVQAYNNVVRTAEEGTENLKQQFKDTFAKVAEDTGDDLGALTDTLKTGIGAIESAVGDGIESGFINKELLKLDAFEAFEMQLRKSTTSYEEYLNALRDGAKVLNKNIDEEGRLYAEHKKANGQIERLYSTTLPAYSEELYEAWKAQNALGEETGDMSSFMEEYLENLDGLASGLGEVEEEVKDLRDIFGDLHNSISKTIDISKKSLEGALSIDDIMALSEEYESWVDLLEIEGDIITLNTEKLQKLNVQKAYTAKFEAMMAGASEKELKFYDAYISQLERAIPMSRDYAQFLQDVALQASELTGSLGGFSQAIGEISRQFEEGELSATQYFEALQSQLSETQFGGLETEQQQLLFTGLVSDASSALSQISSMFDAGEIDILGYSEQLMGVMGIFQQLGSIAQASGVDVSGSLDQMSNATMRLAELQELNLEIAKVVQLQASENLKVGTEEFAVYAQNMAQLAIDAGIQVQDMQGNVFTSASQIAQWMMGSQANFNEFTQQTAQATGSTIGELVGSAGDLLVSLGDEISNFKGQINIVPKINFVQTEITAGNVSLPMFLPSVTLDVTGSSTSLAKIGGAVKAFGEQLKGMGSSINLSNDIYNLAKPLNQVTGAGGQVSDVYDKLQDAIGGATDKTKELTDAVEEMRKKQLEALKDQLDSYNKIINKRKQLLETMSAERRYQDELEDRQKSIADLQKEILELSMDSSEEAKRRRQELEAQMSEQQKELDTFQFEHSVDQQQAMLEEERQRFEDQIAGAIKIIENIEADNVQEFINKLREALGYIPTEQSTPAPMSAIQSADAFISNQTLSSAMSGSSLTGSFSSIGDKLANLTLSGSPQITTREVNFSVEKLMEINVAGNLDESVLPDIEAISQQVIGKINEIMNLRGFARNAGSYSI